MTAYTLIDAAQPSTVLEGLDLHCTPTRDLEWLRHHARKAGYLDDVAILTDELERRVTL